MQEFNHLQKVRRLNRITEAMRRDLQLLSWETPRGALRSMQLLLERDLVRKDLRLIPITEGLLEHHGWKPFPLFSIHIQTSPEAEDLAFVRWLSVHTNLSATDDRAKDCELFKHLCETALNKLLEEIPRWNEHTTHMTIAAARAKKPAA